VGKYGRYRKGKAINGLTVASRYRIDEDRYILVFGTFFIAKSAMKK